MGSSLLLTLANFDKESNVDLTLYPLSWIIFKYERPLSLDQGEKMKMSKDYKVILKKDSINHSIDYLLGNIRCLVRENIIGINKGMELIDYAEELALKKRGKLND